MTRALLPYDEPSTPAEMTADAAAASLALHLPHQATATRRSPTAGLAGALRVPEAAADLAGRFAE